MLSIAAKVTAANITVVSKSNNIIFTLNLLTINLMNNLYSHEHDAKVIIIVHVHKIFMAIFAYLADFIDLYQKK